MIRLFRVGKRGQTRRGGVAPAPATSPPPVGSVGGDRHPPTQPRTFLDSVDEAVALAAYERWIGR